MYILKKEYSRFSFLILMEKKLKDMSSTSDFQNN